jgi:DnaJ-domain-containing protein 1
MLIQALMYYVLMFQCGLVFLLSIPYANSTCQRVIENLDKSFGKNELVRKGLQFIFFVIILMFVQAIVQMQGYYEKDNWTVELRNKQLYAQRDAYISGFNLFIMALLRLVYKNLLSNNRLTANMEAMSKQAAGLQNAYKSLSDEKDKQESNLAVLKELVKEKDENFDLEKFLKANHDLKLKLTESENLNSARAEEIESIKKDFDCMKKQAESQGDSVVSQMDAFNKLSEENATLKDKLENSARCLLQVKELEDENKSLKDQLKEMDLKLAKGGNKKND